MKYIRWWFFIVSIFIVSPVFCITESKILTITPDKLYALLSTDRKEVIHVISVLPPFIYRDCNILSSINIPIDQLIRNEELKKWDKHDTIILYSADSSCPLSQYAFETMHELGFVNVAILVGGLKEWNHKAFPTNGLCKAGFLKSLSQKA